MPIQRLIKTNFTAGEIAPQLLGRGDLRAYENGAKTLQNMTIQPTGGLSRRRGSYFVDFAAGKGRLIAFEFNTEQTYLVCVTHLLLTIYRNGIKLLTLPAPWTSAQIPNLTWTQSADTILLCHGDVKPQKLVRQSDQLWTLGPWQFVQSQDALTNTIVCQPYYRFADDNITLMLSDIAGPVTVTASAPCFQPGHVGAHFRFRNREISVMAYSSPYEVTARVIGLITDATATTDWDEQAFSDVNGYPQCAVFHQDRLVIGGSRALPNRLWLSKSDDLFNFDKGTGLDDESIEFGLYSDQINAIRALFSGRHLQVFTSGAEWIVTGTPLTPTSVQLDRQTRIGSVMTRYVPPVDVDGATLFVGRTGQDMREFLYTDVEDAYQANDLALLARHFFKDPVDQCFDPFQRIMYLPLLDGTMAALTIYRTEEVLAWARVKTDGAYLSVATVDDSVYALVNRNNAFFIERFDAAFLLDACLSGTVQNPTTIWSGLNHLEGRSISVIADGAPVADTIVLNGQITLDNAARSIVAGLPYTHILEPLPPGILAVNGGGRATRLIKAVFRLQDTQALTVDTGRGLKDITLRQGATLDELPQSFSGDMTVHAFGWTNDGTAPLWRLEQTTPLPCTILGVTMDIKVNA